MSDGCQILHGATFSLFQFDLRHQESRQSFSRFFFFWGGGGGSNFAAKWYAIFRKPLVSPVLFIGVLWTAVKRPALRLSVTPVFHTWVLQSGPFQQFTYCDSYCVAKESFMCLVFWCHCTYCFSEVCKNRKTIKPCPFSVVCQMYGRPRLIHWQSKSMSWIFWQIVAFWSWTFFRFRFLVLWVHSLFSLDCLAMFVVLEYIFYSNLCLVGNSRWS